MAAPRYDTHPAARRGRQAATTAGTHPTPTHPPNRADPRRPDPRRAAGLLLPEVDGTAAAEAQAGSAVGLLPHGYTAAAVDELARTAAKCTTAERLDPGEVYETCWGTIVEYLYQTANDDTRPGPGLLVLQARRALSRYIRDELRHHGQPYAILTDRTNFHRYWDWATTISPSPERRTVEQATLTQIWPLLRPTDQETFAALAATGTYHDAAVRLGLNDKAFRARIGRARARFLALWHEHETPSKLWRVEITRTDHCREHGRRLARTRQHRAAQLAADLNAAEITPQRAPQHDDTDIVGEVAGCGPRLAADDTGAGQMLRFGYTMGEVERLTRVAVARAMVGALDASDVYEAAWGSIVERLYTATTRPAAATLVIQARKAVANAAHADARQRGLPFGDRDPAGNFLRYWAAHTAPLPSPEPEVVERAALPQALAALRPLDQTTFTAFARTGSYQAAAEQRGLKDSGVFGAQMSKARSRFFAVWFEHEAPPPSARRTRPPAGTYSAAGRRLVARMRQRRAADAIDLATAVSA